MFLWNALAFSMKQWILVIWSLAPLPFLIPAWTSGSSLFMYCWSLAWRILSITLLVCEMSAIVWEFEHSLALPFFVIGMKADLFQSCGHWWVFQVYWHIECSTFTASSFRIWNISTGIPSPWLACFYWCFLRPTCCSETEPRKLHTPPTCFKLLQTKCNCYIVIWFVV